MLATIIDDLLPALAARVSTLWVEPAPDGWQVRISYNLMVGNYPGEVTLAGPYAIVADLEALPDGVTATGKTRYPESTHPLDVWGDDPAPHVEHMIRELSERGTLGTLDWHRHDDGRWTIKTHAGSDKERAEWVKSLSR